MIDIAAIWILIAAVVMLAYVIYRLVRADRQFRILELADHVKVSSDHPHLPDAAIEDDKPIAFPVGGGKHLYLRPFSRAKLGQYMIMYSNFLLATHNRAAGLQLVSMADSPEDKKDILADWASLSYDKKLKKMQDKIIRKIFLDDKATNPQGVTMRDIDRLGWDVVLMLWQYGYDRNVKAVEDFTTSRMTSLRGAANAKAGSDLQGLASTGAPIGSPLCPDKCSG